MRGSTGSAGKVVLDRFTTLEKLAPLVRSDFLAIAEKNRSLGFLNENISDLLTDLSASQFPKAHELMELMVGSLSRVEYARKVMYHRTRLLGEQAFQSSMEQVRTVKGILNDCEQALNRAQQASAAQARAARRNDLFDRRAAAASGTFKAANAKAVQASSVYSNQINRDLSLALLSFAHAQMEMYARTLEVWGNAIEQIDKLELNEEAEAASDALEAAVDTITPLMSE
jgi:hypothetical protein